MSKKRDADKKYQRWVIQRPDGMFKVHNTIREGWSHNLYEAAYYNYKQAESIIGKEVKFIIVHYKDTDFEKKKKINRCQIGK